MTPAEGTGGTRPTFIVKTVDDDGDTLGENSDEETIAEEEEDPGGDRLYFGSMICQV